MARLPKYWTEQTALDHCVERIHKQPIASGGFVANNYNATCRCAIGQLASRAELRHSILQRRGVYKNGVKVIKRGRTRLAGYENTLKDENPSYAQRCSKLHKNFLADMRITHDSIFEGRDSRATGERKAELTEEFRQNIQNRIDCGDYK